MKSRKLAMTILISASAMGAGWLVATRSVRSEFEGQSQGATGFPRPALSALASPTRTSTGGTPSERMFRALDDLSLHGSGDFSRRLGELDGLSLDGEVARVMREGLLCQWIAVDAGAAFQWALSRGIQGETEEMVSLWAIVDVEATLAALDDVEDSGLRWQLRVACATAIAQRDRSRAVEILTDHKLLNRAPDAFFTELARQDIGMALEVVGGMRYDYDQARAFASIYRQWAAEDPRAAVTALSGDARMKNASGTVWEAVADEWFSTDPKGAAVFFAATENLGWMAECVDSVMAGWGKDDFEGALAFARGLAGEARGDALAELAESLVGERGAVAFRAVCEEGMGGRCENVAARWASQDWEGALTAILALEQGPVRDAALRGFTSGLRNNEVVASAGVGKWVEPFMDMAPENSRESLDLSWAVPSLSLEEIGMYSARYGDRFVRAIADGVHSLASHDPEAASKIVASLPESGARAGMTQAVVAGWALADGPAAAEWASFLGDGRARDVAFRNVANAWVRHDSEQARQWIESLPPSAAADAAISEYVGMVSTRGSKKLVELARSIGSEAQRDTAMLSALQGWVGREGEAAVEAIGELDLPEAVREQFTSFAEGERWWREQGN